MLPKLNDFNLGLGSINPSTRNEYVDGRLDENGVRLNVPSGAGGSFGLYVAKLLSSSLIDQNSEKVGLLQVIDRLK